MNILTDLQQETLKVFFSVPELKKKFYLTGGTALSAFYLEHRLSEDLDFFTHYVELHSVEKSIEDAFTSAGLRLTKERGSPTFRRYRINSSLQVDIVKDIDFRIGTPELRDGFMVDNPKNIAVNKVTAIYGRLEPKDYVDLYFLKPFSNYKIMELLQLAKNKDAGLEPFQWAKIIADVESINVLPVMLKPLRLENLKKFFHHLRDEIVDAIKPLHHL